MDMVTIATVRATKDVVAELRYRAADRLRVCRHFKFMLTASESASRPDVWLIQASARDNRK
jgi:hypothetical protein